jgi:hypothetical protein
MTSTPPTPETGRCIALGASNLTRSLPTWLAAARVASHGPVECIVAAGNGRSFGARSRFLGRELPGILDSQVFSRLCGPRRGVGAILDVGNDLLYGSSVATVLGWVDACLARLSPHVERLVVAGLPPVEDGSITPFRFELIRRVLVPSCRLGLEAAVDAARELQLGLGALASRHGAAFVDLPRHYYGTDPIHVTGRHRAELCARMLGVDADEVRAQGLGWSDSLRVRTARPTLETIWGIARRGSPPQVRFSDGSTLSLD